MTAAKLYGTPAKGEGTRTSPIEIDSDVDNKAKAGPSRSPQVQRGELGFLPILIVAERGKAMSPVLPVPTDAVPFDPSLYKNAPKEPRVSLTVFEILT